MKIKLNKIDSQKKFNTKTTFEKLWKYLEGSKGIVALVIVLSVLSGIFQGVSIYLSFLYKYCIRFSVHAVLLCVYNIAVDEHLIFSIELFNRINSSSRCRIPRM